MSSTAHILDTAKTLLRYREEEFLCDTSIITNDRQIKAHSVLLAAVSPVFRGAFELSASSSGMYQVDLQSVESHVLETALDFIYTGQLIVPSPDYATQDQLATLFTTLQDLGLDINKLNGCEIKFKRDMRQPSKRVNKKVKEASSSKFQNDGNEVPSIKNEVESASETDLPGKSKDISLKEQSVIKTDESTRLKEQNEYSQSATAEDVNGCDGEEDADPEEGEMDEGDDEQCLLVEQDGDAEGEEPKFYFMLVPNKDGSGVEVGESQQYDSSTGQQNSSNKLKLLTHIKSSLLCDICGHSFTEKSALDKHLVLNHGSHSNNGSNRQTAAFHCTVCGELFEGDDQFREHLESSLNCADAVENSSLQMSVLGSGDDRRPFLCDTCGKNFSSALSLRMHTKLHTGERPFSCSTCGKSFVQKVQLIQHEQRHLGIRPYACDLCDRTFSQKGQLTLHTRLHTGERPFMCEFCDAAYVSRPLLTQHRRMHTGERPHVCATCSKNFAHKESLIVHMRTHTGEKPFECTICGNRYTQSHHLKGHMRTHTGEKPFSCHLCDKTYKNRVDLRFHCTRVHGIDISKRKTKPIMIAVDMVAEDQ